MAKWNMVCYSLYTMSQINYIKRLPMYKWRQPSNFTKHLLFTSARFTTTFG